MPIRNKINIKVFSIGKIVIKTTDDINSFLGQRRLSRITKDDKYRTKFETDMQRILFSDAFRRLQAKTQVLQLSESDFHRTRLTHSIEVATIAKSISKKLEIEKKHISDIVKIDHDLIQAIAYAHDLGHPPFGHGGEIALNYMMSKHGGFEGNGQTLRILSKLAKYSDNHGMNLTRRALLGILKYPCSFKQVNNSVSSHCEEISFHTLNSKLWTPPKCYFDCDQDIVDWILEPFSQNDKKLFTQYTPDIKCHAKSEYKSFDCSIMDLADEIAYAMHDFEDAYNLGLIDNDDIEKIIKALNMDDLLKSYLYHSRGKKPDEIIKYINSSEIKHAVSIMIGYFIDKASSVILDKFENEHFRYNIKLETEAKTTLNCFKKVIKEKVIDSTQTKMIEKRGQIIICYLFDALSNDKKLMPKTTQKKYEQAEDYLKNRVVCDYISGMTDDYAIKTYKKIFGQENMSYFEK